MANPEELSRKEKIYVALTIAAFILFLGAGLYEAMVIPKSPGQEYLFFPFFR